MDPTRLYRFRRTTHPHRPAPSPVRRATALDRRQGVRGRYCRDQPPARSRFDPARHLLRLAAPGSARRRPRRCLLHRPRPDPHPGPLGRLLSQPSAELGTRQRPRVPAPRFLPWPSTPPLVSCRPVGSASARGRPSGSAGSSTPSWAARRRRPSARTWCWCSLPAVRWRSRSAGKADPGRRVPPAPSSPRSWPTVPSSAASARSSWVAFKVGALSYGGGFVIIPLMQHDVVTTYHWMTGAPVPERRRPRPGHPRSGRPDRGRRRLRRRRSRRRSPGRAGRVRPVVRLRARRWPPLRPDPSQPRRRGIPHRGRDQPSSAPSPDRRSPSACSFQHLWQIPVLAGALLWLFVVRRGVVSGLLVAGAVGIMLALAGVPV